MSTQHLERPALTEHAVTRTSRGPLLWWYAAAAVLFFAVPLVGTDWMGLQPDLYYLGYFTVALLFLGAFAARHRDELRELWTANLWQSLCVGAAVGGLLVVGILQQAGSAHAEGWRFPFEIVWRGLVYGTVDALTLVVFPAAVAYLLLRGNRTGARRRVGFAGLALALSLVVTGTYHLGYGEFRDQTIRYPEIGAVVANIPTVLTGNPVGGVVTHATMHVVAVVHQRDGGSQHMLPPRVDSAYPDHGSSDLAAGLAAGWLLAGAVAVAAVVRRRRTWAHAGEEQTP